jgi:hypothetical protein
MFYILYMYNKAFSEDVFAESFADTLARFIMLKYFNLLIYSLKPTTILKT